MKLSKKQIHDKVLLGHDYIPNWPSEPGTIVEIIWVYKDMKAIKIEFYNGGTRWYSIESFTRNFEHYKNCVKCFEIKNREKK